MLFIRPDRISEGRGGKKLACQRLPNQAFLSNVTQQQQRRQRQVCRDLVRQRGDRKLLDSHHIVLNYMEFRCLAPEMGQSKLASELIPGSSDGCIRQLSFSIWVTAAARGLLHWGFHFARGRPLTRFSID